MVKNFIFAVFFLEKVTFSEVRKSGASSSMICVRRFGGSVSVGTKVPPQPEGLCSLSASLLQAVIRSKGSELLWESFLLSLFVFSNPSWGFGMQMVAGIAAQSPKGPGGRCAL